MSSPQRAPAKEMKIADIKAEDTRVSAVGTVVGSNGGVMLVDDGAAKVKVTFEEPPAVSTGQLVRLFGRPVPAEGGFEIQGEACQDFSGADMQLYAQVSAAWESSLRQL